VSHGFSFLWVEGMMRFAVVVVGLELPKSFDRKEETDQMR
jgi:hypothetical protein